MTSPSSDRAVQLEAAVERFFESAATGDFDTFRACFAKDAEVFQNGEQLTVDQLVEWSQNGVEGVQYSDVRRTIAEETVVEQHRVEVILPGGQKFSPPEVCVVFRFDTAGLFSRVDEYAPLTAIPR